MIIAFFILGISTLWAQDPTAEDVAELIEETEAENASNPLAKVKNTDVRVQYLDNPDGSYRWDFWLADGAFMATEKLKIKYEAH